MNNKYYSNTIKQSFSNMFIILISVVFSGDTNGQEGGYMLIGRGGDICYV